MWWNAAQLAVDLGNSSPVSYQGQRMKMWQLTSRKCRPVIPSLMCQSGNSVIELHHWRSNKLCTDCAGARLNWRNIKGQLDITCQPTVLQITLIWKHCAFSKCFLREPNSSQKHLFWTDSQWSCPVIMFSAGAGRRLKQLMGHLSSWTSWGGVEIGNKTLQRCRLVGLLWL